MCCNGPMPEKTDVDLAREQAPEIDGAVEFGADQRQRGVMHRMRREVVGQVDEGLAWDRLPKGWRSVRILHWVEKVPRPTSPLTRPSRCISA